MRLFTKIYLLGVLLLSVSFLVSGYFLTGYSLETSLERETDFAVTQYQYDKFTVLSEMLSSEGEIEDSKSGSQIIWNRISEEITAPFAVMDADKRVLYSEITEPETAFLEKLSSEVCAYCYAEEGGRNVVRIGSTTNCRGNIFYFLTCTDITEVFRQHDTMMSYFRNCYIISLIVGMFLMAGMSMLLTRPLRRVSDAARRIAGGDYGERLPVSGEDEIGMLAGEFNRMAEAVEGKVKELSDAARQKEDFAANFAHELKTPLTSIIGYADMIYQKEPGKEETKKAAWYIWNEGMRLEALSYKLMELTVLKRQDFPLMWLPAEELFADMQEGFRPVAEKGSIRLKVHAKPGYVKADYDLLKTLLMNLIDNAVKAGSTRIEITGEKKDKSYRINVSDNGCGIPSEELSRITEAFYMADKSRSRKQHGAGLGLALAERIACIHGTSLCFQSEEGEGTSVSLELICEEGGDVDA